MVHYIYKITNIKTLEFYIGVRSSKDIENDKYMGSSSVWDKEYIKKNKDILVKEIIFYNFISRDEANKKEIEIIKDNINNELCVNILVGKIPSHLGKKHSKEFVLKRINAWKQPPFKGKHHTDEAKKSMSEKLKGHKPSNLQKQVTSERLKGVPKTDAIKMKISKTKKERIANGSIKKTYKKLYVLNIETGQISEYEGCKVFADINSYSYGSVKYYARKNKIYLKKYLLTYTAFIGDDDRKLGELLGNPEEDNQQPSIDLND